MGHVASFGDRFPVLIVAPSVIVSRHNLAFLLSVQGSHRRDEHDIEQAINGWQTEAAAPNLAIYQPFSSILGFLYTARSRLNHG